MTTKTAEVLYRELNELQKRGQVDPMPSEEVEGTLLVGTKFALRFEASESERGYDLVKVFPAFHNGQRCWLISEDWVAMGNYCASGTNEYIIPFEDGVRIFLQRGVFEFPVPAV